MHWLSWGLGAVFYLAVGMSYLFFVCVHCSERGMLASLLTSVFWPVALVADVIYWSLEKCFRQ